MGQVGSAQVWIRSRVELPVAQGARDDFAVGDRTLNALSGDSGE